MKKIDKNNTDRFDFEYADANIKFYLNKNIPRIEGPEPDGVHGTEYTVVLENASELDDETLKNFIVQQ